MDEQPTVNVGDVVVSKHGWETHGAEHEGRTPRKVFDEGQKLTVGSAGPDGISKTMAMLGFEHGHLKVLSTSNEASQEEAEGRPVARRGPGRPRRPAADDG
jgi:hypothetical protein